MTFNEKLEQFENNQFARLNEQLEEQDKEIPENDKMEIVRQSCWDVASGKGCYANAC